MPVNYSLLVDSSWFFRFPIFTGLSFFGRKSDWPLMKRLVIMLKLLVSLLISYPQKWPCPAYHPYPETCKTRGLYEIDSDECDWDVLLALWCKSCTDCHGQGWARMPRLLLRHQPTDLQVRDLRHSLNVFKFVNFDIHRDIQEYIGILDNRS